MAEAETISVDGRRWRGWTSAFLIAALGFVALLLGFVALLDPYGIRVRAGQAARPLMDINQRFMYPQLVRSGAFDSAVLGTSTLRLLDPAILSAGAGGRFVNLAMNAATPWEQTQMASLFARRVEKPGAVIWGVDGLWCNADATDPARRLTPRPFPPWLYGSAPGWSDFRHLLDFTSLEVSARLLAHRLGLMPARIRGDGYEVFTPPEASYDIERARFHLRGAWGAPAPELGPLSVPEPPDADERSGWRFPALAWLDDALGAFPPSTRLVLVLPPAHAIGLPREGSVGWRRHEACKAEIGRIATRHGAALADYAYASPLTREDANYWDGLHYRLPIARRIESDLVAILKGAQPAPDAALRLSRTLR